MKQHHVRDRWAYVIGLLVGGALVGACGSPAPEPLATVGEEPISDQQFDAYLRHRAMSPRGEEATQEALDEYLRREALTQAIEGTDVLEQAAIEAELRELRKEMLISRYFDRFLRTAVTDDAIQNYYNEHAADYEDHEVHAAHILVRTNRRMSEEERQAASTRAQEAYAQLQTGRDFAEVAAQYSDDAVSSSRGGDLGWVRENAIDPRFSERAFATEAGAYTEPFETPFGWHIVKVLEAPATRHRPLSTVEGDIRYQLRAEAREAEIQRLLGTVEIAQREGGFRRRPRAGEPAPGEPGATAPSASAREPSVGETEEAPRAAAPTEPGTEHE